MDLWERFSLVSSNIMRTGNHLINAKRTVFEKLIFVISILITSGPWVNQNWMSWNKNKKKYIIKVSKNHLMLEQLPDLQHKLERWRKLNNRNFLLNYWMNIKVIKLNWEKIRKFKTIYFSVNWSLKIHNSMITCPRQEDSNNYSLRRILLNGNWNRLTYRKYLQLR